MEKKSSKTGVILALVSLFLGGGAVVTGKEAMSRLQGK
jgi:hypothetical protein